MRRSSLTALLVLVGPFAVAAESQVGLASVIDGDTLKINGVSHRLEKIDAPELEQTCGRDGVEWLCGAESAQHLRQLIRSREVLCDIGGKDGYGRMLSVCYVGKRNLNAEMVAAGYALAYRKYGDDFVAFEDHAREGKLGLWAGTFVEPWEYRRKPAVEQIPPDGCVLKGNINSKGVRLYHRPADRSYAQTVITPEKGERWFCSEDDAIAAGWLPAWGPRDN